MVYFSKYQVELSIIQEYLTNHFRCKKYFHLVTNCKHKIFRTKNPTLPNVIQSRGRNRRPYSETLCPTCNVLGNEYHCLCECEKTRYGVSSLFRQVYVPTGRQVYIPTGRYSDRSIIRQVVIPTGRYSDRSLG